MGLTQRWFVSSASVAQRWKVLLGPLAIDDTFPAAATACSARAVMMRRALTAHHPHLAFKV